MATEQNHTAPFERSTSLPGNLPQVLIERENDPRISFTNLDDLRIWRPAKVRQHPDEIVTVGPQYLNEFFREILVSQQPHQAGAG